MSFKCFQNTECEFFKCHKLENPIIFNCLFCFCPLYGKTECKGNYKLTVNGVKDCSDCVYPHQGEKGHNFVMAQLSHMS